MLTVSSVLSQAEIPSWGCADWGRARSTLCARGLTRPRLVRVGVANVDLLTHGTPKTHSAPQSLQSMVSASCWAGATKTLKKEAPLCCLKLVWLFPGAAIL